MRIATELTVKALIRRCNAAGVSAFVMRRGDEQRGALFVKIATLDGRAKLLGPPPATIASSSASPSLVPHLAPEGAPETEVDAYLARQRDYDEDLWVVEIEDRAGRTFADD